MEKPPMEKLPGDAQPRSSEAILTVVVLVLLLVFYIATQSTTVRPSREASDARFREDSIRAGMRSDRTALLAREQRVRDSLEESDAFFALGPAARRIRKAHPNWSFEACEMLARREVWIGMTYDMLLYLRGRPDITNVSNYGRGSQYQYCWTGHTPSCFYDTNADGVIDAFN